MDTVALTELMKMDKKICQLFDTEFDIKILSKKFNIVYKISNTTKSCLAKVGFRGWSYSEWEVLNLLHKNNFLVPRPIQYIPLSDVHITNWTFGDLKQENGIIFYESLSGTELTESLTPENIKGACKLLKRLHEEIDYKNHVIPRYQEFEVERGLKYARDIFSGSKLEKLEKKITNYSKLEIKPTFIHGDARLEHFIITSKGLGMFDFEGACNGDPCKDFGVLKGDLAIHDINLNPLLEDVLDRKLTMSEKNRIEFFELRKHLVSMKYSNDEKARELVESKL